MRPPSIPTTIPINRDDSKQLVIMKSLYNSLIEHREPKTNRILIQDFICLPSRKDFHEYFDIIRKPIAMNKIRERIERQLYPDEESCIEDFKLMFENCKFFNEDESQIYKDAVSLENVLYKRKEQLHVEHNRPSRDSNQNDESINNSIKVNHNHHNDTSMDSSSNLSADLIASTPIEKCSLNTRRGKNSDVPKRQLLTGYIIYASEVRKQVIDRNPNQNFGDISRLVGNEWKALPHDIRSKYDQRALIHNKRVRERTQRDSLEGNRLVANGNLHQKLTKRKLAKLAKEQMRQHHLSIASGNNSSFQDRSSPMVTTDKHQHSQPQSNIITTADSSTQTTAIRFVEPPTRKRLVYSETFRKYIESLQIPVEDTTPEKPVELPTHWLGAGHGRHESPEAALWALRDYMLQDAVTMRRSMEPYL